VIAVDLTLFCTGIMPGESRLIMTKISFVLNYTKTKAVPPYGCPEFEKPFATMDSALTFCAQLVKLGGKALYIIKSVHGAEDSVLEGEELTRLIETHRPGREAA
jgi:hypothetical protein